VVADFSEQREQKQSSLWFSRVATKSRKEELRNSWSSERKSKEFDFAES
jgi:hypothetical protein